MPRPRLGDDASAAGYPAYPHARYLVMRREDRWFIELDAEEYGPYETEREAMLFAIDAAQKLGEQGEETQVLLIGDNGTTLAVWSYGQHPYRC